MTARPTPLRLVNRPDRVQLEGVMGSVARGDQYAFEQLYEHIAPVVFGIIRRVVRDPAQSEEVAQEVLLEVWRTATRYDPERGTVLAWVSTMAHRRAVDRVRSEEAASAREQLAARRDHQRPFDQVAETTEANFEHGAVRHCLDGLTTHQRESVQLTYYSGLTYREAAELLGAPLGTVKTRIRDGLIRLRDCLGVTR